MGYSRHSFYRLKQLYHTGGKGALHEISQKKPITKIAFILEIFDKRLKALEGRMVQEGLILTEAQLMALERKKGSGQRQGITD